jgi:hypothetical protein
VRKGEHRDAGRGFQVAARRWRSVPKLHRFRTAWPTPRCGMLGTPFLAIWRAARGAFSGHGSTRRVGASAAVNLGQHVGERIAFAVGQDPLQVLARRHRAGVRGQSQVEPDKGMRIDQLLPVASGSGQQILDSDLAPQISDDWIRPGCGGSCTPRFRRTKRSTLQMAPGVKHVPEDGA